ncbi:deoxyribose-phosphate aldolase [Anaerotruncus massiliensis (ex Liu et al. 2021)]|uniref:Deoxyribose-phosphate aldolase n=2 Tax=Anaerotruncus TaxID=244127 RepID=A0A498CT50_9FIRM|nr:MULTISPECIES: deoxyribose-phosphate aldolase [Anaerotruncus]MBC3937856.1 deoxyribose-phosphate aldolase [Anaerotruncus massiliensis (ex Togo et al. 2019)]RLL13851.1 deoxyribose-phosphate aldolase [Anaerotruncus massiliensis (ex Liu et al. 2021)]
MNRKQLAKMMDHTILKATATPAQVEQICREALEIGAASVCINPCNIEQARRLLDGSGVRVCTVIGFPLGANTPEVKAFETQDAIRRGAEEVDMVINVGALLAGNDETVYRDIKAVVDAAAGTLTKVIIETCYLSDDQKKTACELAMRAGADFVKTSTGFGTGGATPHDVALMRGVVGSKLQVKASGGIRTYEDAAAVVEAGADRLGVSASLTILQGIPE